MLALLFGVVALGACGGAGFLLGIRHARRQERIAPVIEDVLALVPETGTRFRVIYETPHGATARTILERATPKPGDAVLLLDGGVLRGRKDG